jgi:NAD(P)-dependent dehydrogenase (short-subunit alcohol dehydrogenase family)
MMIEHTDREAGSVLVCGSSRVADATVQRLLSHGYQVGRFGGGSFEGPRDTDAASGSDLPISIPGDPLDPDDVRAAVATAATTFGRLGAVVLAPELPVPAGTLLDFSDSDLAGIVGGAFAASIATARASAEHLVKSGGAFMAVVPLSGVRGVAEEAASGLVMHGIVGLVRSMALDFGAAGVRSNVVSHGLLADDLQTDPRRADLRRIPMRRAGTADEVAAVVRHLISSRASYTNGSIQVVDGGVNAGYLEVAE